MNDLQHLIQHLIEVLTDGPPGEGVVAHRRTPTAPSPANAKRRPDEPAHDGTPTTEWPACMKQPAKLPTGRWRSTSAGVAMTRGHHAVPITEMLWRHSEMSHTDPLIAVTLTRYALRPPQDWTTMMHTAQRRTRPTRSYRITWKDDTISVFRVQQLTWPGEILSLFGDRAEMLLGHATIDHHWTVVFAAAPGTYQRVELMDGTTTTEPEPAAADEPIPYTVATAEAAPPADWRNGPESDAAPRALASGGPVTSSPLMRMLRVDGVLPPEPGQGPASLA